MDFITQLFGKRSNYPAEYKRYKKAMGRNPTDHGLKTQFINFCLLSRFSGQEIDEDHIPEALALFETLAGAEGFDLQCYYLVGKYYQEARNNRKAYRIYLNAIKRFNEHVEINPELKSENVELAYSISLNLMGLQSNPVDAELQKCFKIIRKSYPLHLKRVELENEMAKPAPDQGRVKQLAAEVRKLKAEEEKETTAAAPAPVPEVNRVMAQPQIQEQPQPGPSRKPEEKKDIFSKLLNSSIPVSKASQDGAVPGLQAMTEEAEKAEVMDFLKLSPTSENAGKAFSFMVFRNNHWEGPYAPLQLLSMGFLKPESWVCRAGSHQVLQAYEVPDLLVLFQQKV